MNFNFGEILTRAWHITWKYKVLWVFGILAGCSQGGGNGSGGGGGGNGQRYSNGPSTFEFPPEIQRLVSMLEDLGKWAIENWWIFIVLGLIALLFILASIFLGTIGRVGLIKGSYDAEQGAENLVFGELFRASMPYFWRVFGLSFLIGLAFLIILLPLLLAGILTAGLGFLCLLPLICLLVPVFWAVSLIVEQANRAIVLEDRSILDGFKRGWEILKGHPGPLIVMSLILFGISFVAGLVIALPILITVLPAIFSLAMNEGRSFTPLYFAIGVICLYAPVSWLLNGILNTFVHSAWTLTWLRLTHKPEALEDAVFTQPSL
ncbi:MAG: hypothetical protein Fur0043_07680 [Anaerolineales bacterium]